MIDRDLLWKAWPDGYLPMRGVSTVGGWTTIRSSASLRDPSKHATVWTNPDAVRMGLRCLACVALASAERCLFAGPHGVAELARGDLQLGVDVAQELQSGDLLPNVDPADTATWACLLEDLAHAQGWDTSRQLGIAWGFMSFGRELAWCLDQIEGGCVHRVQPYFVDNANQGLTPAHALVLARIKLREQT